MGLVDADEVPPFFLLRGAYTEGQGHPIQRETKIETGTVVRAEKIDLELDDLAAAADPPPRREREIRLAFVLLAEAGDPQDQVMELAADTDWFRRAWTDWAQQKLGCRTSLCTRADGSCPPLCDYRCGDGRCDDPEDPRVCAADCAEGHRLCRYQCATLPQDCPISRDPFCRDKCAAEGPAQLEAYLSCRTEHGRCHPYCWALLRGEETAIGSEAAPP